MRKVAIVGARRVKQGIGEFIARGFPHAGARVVGVCGRTPETAAEAGATLKREYGIEAAAFTSVTGMLESTRPDIIAICSPTRTHREHLEQAARFPVHVLCEKPLWWAGPTDIESETGRLLDLFEGRLFRLNTQWPYTLDAFRKLHGDPGPVTRFSMRLSPVSEGLDRLLDSAPHLISMLQALAGRGRLEDPRWEGNDRLTFRYLPESGPPAAAEFLLRRHIERPRPGWYAVNDLRVDRTIRMPDYTFEFTGAGRTVPMEDPLDLLIKDFLEAVEKGIATRKGDLLDSMTLLRQMFEAAP